MNGTRDHEGREINLTREDKYDVMLSLMGHLDLNIYVCVYVYVVCMYMGYKSRRGVYEREDRVLKGDRQDTVMGEERQNRVHASFIGRI